MREPTTKGDNVRYGRQETDIILEQLYTFFKENNLVVKLLSFPLNEKLSIHNQINSMEIKLDNLILSDPRLYQGIQKIYREHGVDIPSQKTIDKGEVISAKKKIIKELLK